MEAYKDNAWQRSMKLRLDINGMMADFVGEHGLSMEDIEKHSAQYIKAAESMAAKRENMKWRELPHNQAEVVARIKTVAEKGTKRIRCGRGAGHRRQRARPHSRAASAQPPALQ